MFEESKKNSVAIIDYGMGNLFSVKRACEHAGLNASITNDKDLVLSSDAMILPGVGAFADAMSTLKDLDLIGPIKDFISSGRMFMGICLGMQLLLSESHEFGTSKGFGLIEGAVIKFSKDEAAGDDIKVPQVGWNKIYKPVPGSGRQWEEGLLKNIEQGEAMYFVHSFYAVPASDDVVLSITEYEGIRYASSMSKDNIFACQFHPEKSAERGLIIYENFANAIRRERSR